jgi:hypothetical protein
VADRLFTLDEARSCLEKLREVLPRIMEAAKEAAPLRDQLRRIQIASAGNGHVIDDEVASKRQRLERLAELINGAVTELHALGIEVKDMERGLVDFPTEISGQPAYLCWMFGEDDIEWWHDLESGFAGRQHL